MRKSPRGFTLIEILVVLGIIVLLAAILLPVLGMVREKGRAAACQSNLKQIYTGLSMYLSDFDRYPHAVDPADKYAPQIWQTQAMAQGFDLQAMPMVMTVLEPYIKSTAVWKCPSDHGFNNPDSIQWQLEGEPTFPSCYAKYGTSYFYRTELMFKSITQDQLNNPTEINVMMDAHGGWHGVSLLPSKAQRRYNVMFADGHVKSIDGLAFDAAWQLPVP